MISAPPSICHQIIIDWVESNGLRKSKEYISYGQNSWMAPLVLSPLRVSSPKRLPSWYPEKGIWRQPTSFDLIAVAGCQNCFLKTIWNCCRKGHAGRSTSSQQHEGGEPDRPALIAQPSARLGMNLRGRRKAKTSKGLQSWDTLGHCCGEFKASSRLLSRYFPTFPHSTQPTHVLCGGQRCGCHPLHVEQPLRGQNPFPKQLMFST